MVCREALLRVESIITCILGALDVSSGVRYLLVLESNSPEDNTNPRLMKIT